MARPAQENLKRLNINMNGDLLRMVDEYGAKLHLNRTSAFAVILTQFFQQQQAMDSVKGIVEIYNAEQGKKKSKS